MKHPGKTKFIDRIDQLMSYPGIDENRLIFKKNEWLATIGSTIAITGMTILAWALVMPTLVEYGFILVSTCIIALVVVPFMRKFVEWLFFTLYLVNLLVTFYFMVKLGGLLHSAGLLFTGISILFISINLQNTRMTIFLFVVYLISLATTALLQPMLTIAPEMTSSKNLLFFTLNCLWQAGFTVMLILNNISQKKKLAEAKQAEANRLMDLDEVKTRLFTNITHEFRTPLTIILGMASLVKEKPGEWLEAGTEKIRTSEQNLLHLVNQMLDLSKLETGAMPLHIFQQDIIIQLRYLIESFSSMALSRNIQLQFKPETDHLLMDYDADKMMHIISNLLSNALKYTQEGGSVVLTAFLVFENGGQKFLIRVHDNGPGIPGEHLPYIFDRFYRIEEDSAQFENGSGLGLALTKELVKLMEGAINVESSTEKGTTFTIQLPVSNNAPLKEMAGFSDVKEKIPGFLAASNKKDHDKLADITLEESERAILLIVEDSLDLVEYLRAILENEYHLEVAANGREGLQKAFEYIPDIILSDLMMPEMDGIAMLEKIKTDQRTSHIPVVMLTAKADIASKLNGLERGADDYLSKPFNEDELRIRLKKLIELRKILRERYASMEALPKTNDKAIKVEDVFMLKIRRIMETQLDNDQFGILELCKEVGMSRAQLYRKFRSLTDKTVNEYLINFRLFKAKEMLMNTDLNVSEVAYEVGFKNLSHFSHAFTKAFGLNPSSIRN
jgi:signal transduction histidine kinase/DNA-binding response OmpR family regulator